MDWKHFLLSPSISLVSFTPSLSLCLISLRDLQNGKCTFTSTMLWNDETRKVHRTLISHQVSHACMREWNLDQWEFFFSRQIKIVNFPIALKQVAALIMNYRGKKVLEIFLWREWHFFIIRGKKNVGFTFFLIQISIDWRLAWQTIQMSRYSSKFKSLLLWQDNIIVY